MSMKTDDFVRAIDSLAPGKELKDRILRLEHGPRRARLERPGRLLAALAAAVAVCACAVAAVLLLDRGGAPDDGRAVGPVISAVSTAATASPSATARPSASISASAYPSGTAGADAPTPSAAAPGTKKTLPAGIVSPEDAITAAVQAYKDYFDIDAGECVLVDDFSYDFGDTVSVIFGTDKAAPPIDSGYYNGKKVLEITFMGEKNETAVHGGECWYFQYFEDLNAEDVQLTLDAVTGKVVFGSLHGYGPRRMGYDKEERVKRLELAQQYVQKPAIACGATVGKAENLKDDSDVAVTMSDGRVITITIDEQREIQGFTIDYP